MRLACPGLPAALAAGATVLTSNQLLASVAKEQFVQTQLAAGLESWPAPHIYSLNAFLAACWQEARYADVDVPPLLSPAQEQAVWQQLIEAEHPSLFDPAQAVTTAVSAGRLISEWHIALEGEPWLASSDTRHFQSLLRSFRKQGKSQGWITRSELWAYLPRWMAQPWWPHRSLVLAGFPYLSPALQALPNARILPIVQSARKKPTPLYVCESVAEEIEQAARWARLTMERTPQTSIGILIADLPTHKHLVARTFRNVFYSDHLMRAPEYSVYYLQVSERLREHPLVASALLFLQLALPRIPIGDASAILRSPLLAGAAPEQNERAIADLQLRRYRDLDVQFADLERSSQACPQLAKTWTAVRLVLQGGGGKGTPAAWSEFIGSLLAALGWPGDRTLSTLEQQIVEAWKASLSDLAALGFVGDTLSYRDALAELEFALDSRSWQTGDLSSPVQILDASAAYGLEFDAVAVCNLAEDVWPAGSRPSPFLPLGMQREILASENDLRSERTAALFAAPKSVAFGSAPLAPIARQWTNPAKGKPRVWSSPLAGCADSPAQVEVLQDSQAPPFPVPEGTAPGGVSILRSQSQCPFQAFATYRLAAKRPEDACFGFDARDRGSFLHSALERVWLTLQTRDRLKETSQAERRALVQAAVANAVGQQDDSPFHQLAGEAERERLEELILEWLVMEASRDEPFTVEHIEKSQPFSVAGLPLSLRLDRVDRLSDGGLVLIDYKSGEPKIKSLEGERPTEPQLLVYASALKESVDGLFFAQMKPRKLRAIGYSRTQQFPKKGNSQAKARDDWDSFLEAATENVETIAGEFVSGWASVDPQKAACTWCNLKPFCRINEGRGETDDDDAD